MSIYFLRHDNLIKIGFSSNLGQRIRSILTAVPDGKGSFLGHMPGDREMEAHLHKVFAAQRFAGEWFIESDDLLGLVRIATDPEMPKTPYINIPTTRTRAEADSATLDMQARLRRIGLRQWPELQHRDRIARLQAGLGLSHRRVRTLYNGEPGAALRLTEIEAVGELEAILAAAANELDPRVGLPSLTESTD